MIAMCRPLHFGVQYEINPWMEGNIGRADTGRAREQWDALHALLAERAEVRVMELTLIPISPSRRMFMCRVGVAANK